MLTVIGSLNGPLHDLSDLYLFTTHMVQHLILAQVFPLLFLLGVPAYVWEVLLRPRWAGRLWDAVTVVPMGFALYTVVFSIWHVPVLYDLMMRQHDFHIVMHLMVMATATWMWWPIAAGAAVRRPISPGAQLLYLFLLGVPMMAVAAMITFASEPLYVWYALAPRMFGLSAVEDQRLGGLIMWIPGGMFYWLVMSVVFFRWSARESHGTDPIELPVPTSDAIFPATPAWSLGKEKR
jgi:putative membrane protein